MGVGKRGGEREGLAGVGREGKLRLGCENKQINK